MELEGNLLRVLKGLETGIYLNFLAVEWSSLKLIIVNGPIKVQKLIQLKMSGQT